MSAIADAPGVTDADRRRYRAEGIFRGDTLNHWIDHWAAHAPDRLAAVGARVDTGSEEITYGALRARSIGFAHALRELGIGKGDAVGLQLPNGVAFLVALHALARLGAVAATVHMPYRKGEIAPLLRHAGARAVVCMPATESYDAPATMTALRDELPELRHVFVAGDAAPEGAHALAALAAARDDPPGPEPGPQDPLVLAFTSGTSASPKAVLRDHESTLANNHQARGSLGAREGDAILSCAPYTHIYGFGALTLTLVVGGTCVLMPAYTPAAMVGAIERSRATMMFGAPAHVASVLKEGLHEGRDLTSLRTVFLGGSLVAPELARDWEAAIGGGRVAQLFGMTESLMTIFVPHDAPAAVRHGFIGRPTPGLEARATGDDGTPVAPGEEGQLEIRGFSVFRGYAGNPDATREAFTPDGWFRTGDLAAIDSSGWVRITGRVKDVINRGGIKINPAEVEHAAVAHPSVLQAAIVPMPDPVLGERACLFVTLQPGAALDFETMIEHLRRCGIAKMRWPERLEIIDEMPLTPTRKVMKRELAKRLEGSG